MLVYAVDLGTTNVKVVAFDERLRRRAVSSALATYSRDGDRVEFSADRLFDLVLDLIGRCATRVQGSEGEDAIIALTGQAESLVLNDRRGAPVRPALSWLDDRAGNEAREIGEQFDADTAFAVTGQPTPSPTWPAAKLRWLARHEPRVLARASQVLMIKDEIIRRFTGTATGEVTTRGFSYLYDVPARRFWGEMLDFVSVSEDTLAPVVPAGTDLGPVRPDVLDRLPAAASYRVNAGALDHFCAMAGTGSYSPGVVSESAGTVLSLSLLTSGWTFDPRRRVSFHPGLRPGEIVLFNGVDSGGASLEWFRREGLGEMAYDDLEEQLRTRAARSAPMFLPYLTGVNPPDYFPDARGAFVGLDLAHDRIDLAYAVEEGVAHLLRRNIDALTAEPITEIVSTGGGASSAFWNQLKADACGLDVLVPDEREATCRGAAALALVASGDLDGLDDVTALDQPSSVRYPSRRSAALDARYHQFDDYLQRLFMTNPGPTPKENHDAAVLLVPDDPR
ncbi:xylulokinase [Nocardioides albertanoniae]|uniref:Xylulokinase n=1 Tax=Nocardioides albertanoniae TaxID=1175486 RepID=A0A543A452_9ACTN|nr:FGGY family carbohydrate kinase [Nocardioides albertanoniae]TQL67375.1 xylulokinase [Nocardioides albertanoniae]